uniref:Myb-like protein X n=1 Tax=Nicotiana sylvestris TaxID=4096 RepID=A0A1U7X8M0_NICSY|nr:PREDICTED: myb-like protein X [Nicotiana sylvestris]
MAKGRVSKTGGRGRDKSPSKRSSKRIKTSQEDELQKSIVAEMEAKPFQVVEGGNAGEEEKENENEEEIEKENKEETENVLGWNAREAETEKEKEEETEKEEEEETRKVRKEKTNVDEEESKEETIIYEREEEIDIDNEASFAIITGLNCRYSYTNSKLQKYLLDGEELWKLIAKGKRSVTVHPFLYPKKAAKMESYIQNLVILSNKEDMMIDNLSKELDGVTLLRHLDGDLKIEKGSFQTPQVGDSHVVGGYDDRTEKSIGGDSKMRGEVVDDDDGGIHFHDDNDRGKEKEQIKWRDNMQHQLNLMNDQLNSMQKRMDDLVQKLSKRHVVLPRAIKDTYTEEKKATKRRRKLERKKLHSSQ